MKNNSNSFTRSIRLFEVLLCFRLIFFIRLEVMLLLVEPSAMNNLRTIFIVVKVFLFWPIVGRKHITDDVTGEQAPAYIILAIQTLWFFILAFSGWFLFVLLPELVRVVGGLLW